MMTRRFSFLLLFSLCAHAQQPAVALDEIIIADRALRMMLESSASIAIPDSVIARDGQSLTQILKNSPIYFKENGFGMVSSPSFRGTTAQQTAVVWNGINVNSQLNGLTDFNAAGARDFDRITVRGGALGTTHGSSAIGGTVHLENTPGYGIPLKAMVHAGFGSFDTSEFHARVTGSSNHVAYSASVSNFASRNDYPLPSGRKNENGQVHVTSASAAASFKSGRHTFTYYGYSNVADRHFALLFPTDPRSRYKDQAFRNMVEWRTKTGWFHPSVKLAHLHEQYDFLENPELGGRAFGQTNSWIGRFEGAMAISDAISLHPMLENTMISADGSDVGNPSRNVLATSIVMRHTVSEKFTYGISVRQESASDYQSPFLFSLSGKFAVSGAHAIKGGLAKSFRAPTFNDLYWGLAGNAELKPEISHQVELGYEYYFRDLQFQATLFGNRITDMIRWIPNGPVQWDPLNEHRVMIFGAEFVGTFKKSIGRHRVLINGHYSYTVSENDDDRQLIYVPLHKGAVSLDWQHRGFVADIQSAFTGLVHTRTDNNPRYALPGYSTVDCRFGYRIKKWTAALLVRNLFDKKYQVVERRYFPGRNYLIQLTFKTQ